MIANENAPIKFVFVHINKTGGNSVNQALEPYGFKYAATEGFGHPDIKFPHSQHWDAHEYKLALGETWEDYIKFAIVRNPWDRMLSQYRKNVCNPKSLSYVKASFDDWLRDAFTHDISPDYEERTIDGLTHTNRRILSPCADWITGDDGKLMVDYIVHFENLEANCAELFEGLGLPMFELPELPQMRSNIRTHDGYFQKIDSYHEMYSNEGRHIVETRFAKDIEMFNYEFGNQWGATTT
jgi:hypothetical protein